MEIEGFKEFQNCLEKSKKNFKTNTDKTLEKTGLKLLRKVKKVTPVDTGHLRRSWNMKKNPNEVVVGTNVKYAPWVENGHRTRNGGFVEGQYMLKKSVEEIEKDLEEEFEIMIENMWE